MSNIEVVRANSDAFSRMDVEAMLGFYASDAVVIDRRHVGWGEFRGHAQLRAYYQGLFDNADAMSEQFDVVSEDGDVIIASCHTSARIAGQADTEVSFRYALRIRLAEGLIESMDIYEDPAAAAAAA